MPPPPGGGFREDLFSNFTMTSTSPTSRRLATIGVPDLFSQLPIELRHAVFTELEIPNIANLRPVSRYWNEVATPDLVPEINLVFKADSFHRLREISQYPAISLHVTSIQHEPNMLHQHNIYDEWAQEICVEDFFHKVQDVDLTGDIRRDLQVYDVNLRKCGQRPGHLFTRVFLAEAHEKYIRLVSEQRNLRNQA